MNYIYIFMTGMQQFVNKNRRINEWQCLVDSNLSERAREREREREREDERERGVGREKGR